MRRLLPPLASFPTTIMPSTCAIISSSSSIHSIRSAGRIADAGQRRRRRPTAEGSSIIASSAYRRGCQECGEREGLIGPVLGALPVCHERQVCGQGVD